MRTKRLFGMKKFMRTMALGLAAMLVAGSLNVMEAEAAGVAGLTYPKWDAVSSTYQYNSSDIFREATHVHFFGENVTTTGVHTHGNIMAENAWIGEIGMRSGKISYPLEYKETSYIGTSINQMESTINGDLILGSAGTIGYVNDAGTEKALVNGSLTAIDPTGDIRLETTTTKAVDIAGTLEYLKGLSTTWSNLPQSSIVNYDLKSDMNNRVINTNQTQAPDDYIVINIDYADWAYYDQYIQIKGLDSDPANEGIVIINVDMKGVQDADMTRGDMKVYDSKGNIYNNTEHSTAAFGSCRLVYNIIDSTAANNIYTGNLKFNNTIFGNILAPGASVTVGAINGNVMAKTIVHTAQESHRLDIFPIFTEEDKVEYEEIRLLLTLTEDPGTSKGQTSNTGYSLYKDYNGATEAVPGNAAFNDLTATWNVDEQKYEVIISSDKVNEAINNGSLSAGEYYLVRENEPGTYVDNGFAYKVVIGSDGTVKYAEVKQSTGEQTTTLEHSVLTDILIKTPAPAAIEDIRLNLDLEGDEETYADGDKSGTKYHLYTDKEGTGTPLTKEPVEAVWDATDKTFKVVIDSDNGDGNLTSSLATHTITYLKKVEPVTKGYNTNENVYEVHIQTDGSVEYRESNNGTFTGSYVKGPLEDLLVKAPANGSAELNVQFNGPTGTAPADNSNVIYQIFTKYENGVPSNPVDTSDREAVKTDSGHKVVFDTGITSALEKGKDYYIAVSGNGSGYKDVAKDVYVVKFDETTGEALYKDANGNYSTTVPTDLLIKNEEVQLNVKLEGDTSGSTNSNVSYDIYDATTGNKVTDTPIQATDSNQDGIYEVIVDSNVTTDKLDRGHEYYIEVSGNNSGYTDQSKDKYYVRFDGNGNAQYSTDKQIWFDDPLTDLLVKAPEPSVEDPSESTPDGGSSAEGESDSDTNKKPSSGSSNSGSSNDGGNTATDGAGADNATDGANANNSAVTGSNSMDSAKTGEVKMGYLFAGFAGVIALAAGVYVFIKRKRA
ncbi:MAG: hypothetical protein IJA29_10090 [Lachnospiraceae bacterium]|nr:hypothetical protein [Lachnospiraceae bacterium]